MSIGKSLKNAMLTTGGLVPFTDNSPAQFVSKQKQHFNDETKTFIQQYAKYASDFVEAQVQGLDQNAPLAWQTRYIRMADVVKPSAAILRRADNYKMVLFADRDVQYLRPGVKIVTMGSTWLVTNPFNISGSDGAGIVERCNAVWNHLDYYGNVISEPMVVSTRRADANQSDAQEGNLITKGYFNVTMQYNQATAQIDTNTRFILGTAAYRVTGYSDFLQEFTGDYGSVRLLEFTIRFEEPNEQIDDMANHVAEGLSFTWDVTINGPTQIAVGQTAQLDASSRRCGEAAADTCKHPISYLWSSSDESVATVDGLGAVTALSEGEATITCTLSQNEAYSASIAVTAVSAGESEVRFTSTIPDAIPAYEDCEITAAYFSDGTETDEALTWTFGGADDGTYRVITGPKTATVYCFGYSETPLTVTASFGNERVSAEIALKGL